jgi:hypothetical protein
MNCGQAGLFCGNRSILSVSKDDANRAMIRKGRKAVMLLFTRRTERRLLLMTISYKVKGTTDWHGDAAKIRSSGDDDGVEWVQNFAMPD